MLKGVTFFFVFNGPLAVKFNMEESFKPFCLKKYEMENAQNNVCGLCFRACLNQVRHFLCQILILYLITGGSVKFNVIPQVGIEEGCGKEMEMKCNKRDTSRVLKLKASVSNSVSAL